MSAGGMLATLPSLSSRRTKPKLTIRIPPAAVVAEIMASVMKASRSCIRTVPEIASSL
jgi:hypothetical protein